MRDKCDLKTKKNSFKVLFIILALLMIFLGTTIIKIQENGGITQTLYQTVAHNLAKESELEYRETINSIGSVVHTVQEAISNTDNSVENNIQNNPSEQEENILTNATKIDFRIAETEISNDSTVHSIVFDDNELQMEDSSDTSIKGQYIIIVEPEQSEVELAITANEKATIQVGNVSQKGSLNITKNTKVMFDDMYVDITITAENEESSLYRVIIHKNTYLTGKVLTEGSYSDINVKMIDENNEIAKEFTSNDGYIYTPVDTENTYKIEIKKDGYLKHTFTNFKAVYGSKNYFGEMYLLAGEVVGNNEYINLNDLVKMTKKSTENTVVNSENSKFDFNGDRIIDKVDADALSTNYNKKGPEEEFEIYDVAPVIEDIEAIIEMDSIKLYATVKDESLDKVIFHINGQDIEGTINREEVTAIYEYVLDFDDEISLTVEAIDTTEKKTVSEEVIVVGNLIRTAEDLVKFSNNVNDKNTYEGKVVNLGADIDMSNVEFTTIGNTRLKTFNGTFNGKEHVISNLNASSLFGYTNNAQISKLGLNGTIEEQSDNISIIKFANLTTIDNCFNIAVADEEDESSVIAENAVGSTITNSYSTFDVIGTSSVGNEIDKCYSTSKVNISDSLLEELGNAYKPDYYRQLNNGYPILKWQKRIAPFVPALVIDTDEGEYDGETVVEQATDTTYELKEPIKDGCAFDGWTIIKGDGVIEDNTFTFGEEDTYIVANWKGDKIYTLAELMKIGEIKLCDTINYNANNTGLENPYTYEAPMNITGGEDTPLFSSDDYMKWKVYSIDKENNKIEIISTDGTPAKLGLNGNVAFANSINILENACNVYGHGYGALSARSLTWEDMEKYTTYDKTTYVSGSEYYGKTYKYTSGYHFKAITDDNGNIIDYENEMTQATTSKPIIETEVGFIINNAIDYFPENIGNLLIYDSKGNTRKSFLASRAVSLYSSTFCRFCLRTIYLGNVRWNKIGEYNNTSGTSTPIDRYNLIPLVTLDTSIKVRKISEGVWEIDTPDEMKETKKLKIGDIVNYDAGNTSKVYEYNTKSELTGSTTSTTFKSNDQMRWRVLSIDDETNQVELISENGTPNNLSFSGTTGFVNCVDVLNDISSIYGHGLAAVGARSINDDDIARYSNFDRTEYFRQKYNRIYYDVKKYTSGNIYKEIKDDNNKVCGYEKTTTTASTSNPITMTQTRYICENAFNTYDYWTASMLVRIVKNYDLDTSRNYWIATQGVDIASKSAPSYGIFYLEGDNINTASSGSHKVCPVVTLSTKINFEYNDNGTWDMVYDTYSIKYNLDGGSFNKENPAEYNEFNEDIIIYQPRKDGYVFLGWTEPNSNEIVRDIIIPSGSKGDKIYTAHWKEETTYSIGYNLDGGKTRKNNPTEYKDSSENIKLVNPTKEGYSFAGWTGTGITEQTKEVIIPYGSTGNRTYTAHWKEMDTNIYATLYTDGTLVFTNDGRIVDGKNDSEVLSNSNITGLNFTSSSMPWYSNRAKVTSVDFVDEVFPSNTSYWFYNLTNLQEIKNIENLNTKNSTSMSYMFYGCNVLPELDLSNFDTSKVTNMSYMFYGCMLVSELDLSSFNTGEVTTMLYMFSNCKALIELDLSSFNTNKVISMSYMFNACNSLAKINLSSFNTSAVTNMSYMFYGCSSLTKLDLTNFNTNKVTTMAYMFYNCSSLTEIKVGENWKTAGTTSNMFSYCGVSCVKYEADEIYAKLYDGNTLILTASDKIIDGKELTKTYGNIGGDLYINALSVPWYNECSFIKNIIVEDNISPILTNYWFYGLNGLTNIDLNKLDTSNIKSMAYMFYNCSKLTSLDISHFITNNVTDMSYMFYGCSGLTSLNIPQFNTNVVTNMSYMFYNCSGLTELNVSNFNTDNVTTMTAMFYGCKKLTSLGLTNFNTANVTSMSMMFTGCSEVLSLDLTSFNTKKVTTMSSMFSNCTAMTEIRVGSDWVTASTNTNMFKSCGVSSVTVV